MKLQYKTWFKRCLELLYPEYESKHREEGVQWWKAVYIWRIPTASCGGGGSSPQSSGCQAGRARLLSPGSVGSHAVSQDCIRELSDALQGDASDGLQMPYNLQKQRDFLVLNNNMFSCTDTLLGLFSLAKCNFFIFSNLQRRLIPDPSVCQWPNYIRIPLPWYVSMESFC